MASCFCGCGTKVKFRLRAINTRGARITDLSGRVGVLIDAYGEADASKDVHNLVAFQDEGMLYMLNLVTFVHLGQDPPPAMEGLTRDWMDRERKLYLDASDPEDRTAGMLYAAAQAQGVTEPEAMSRSLERGDFDMFAALKPTGDFRDAYETLAALGLESGLIESLTPYRYEVAEAL